MLMIIVQGNTKFVPMPPNIQTVNMLFGTDITKKEEMVAWLNKRRPSAGAVNIFLKKKLNFTLLIQRANQRMERTWQYPELEKICIKCSSR